MAHECAKGDPKCVERQDRQAEIRQAWLRAWPKHCTVCEGAGAFHTPGSYWEPPSDEPCEHCTGQGICARCGAEDGLDEDGNGPCKVCGWNYDDQEPHVEPCWCEFDEN
jgi:hypothetical protein